MHGNNETIGLIAGGGQFPLMIADAVRKQSLDIVAVAHLGETDPVLSEKVDDIVWIKLGQLGQLIKALKKRGVQKALMAGSINKKRMFGNIRPDLKGITIMSKMAVFHDDNILVAVAGEFAKEGIEIISSIAHLPELLTPARCFTRKKPSKSEKDDIFLDGKLQKNWDVWILVRVLL